jgi:TolB-like protein
MGGKSGIILSMFRFGEFELDLDRYELRRGGEVVKAEPRVLEVLHYLIERRDRVVPKEELHDGLWPDVHVSESALTTAIRDARRVLEDSPSDPRWIRTVYGRGFRFVGDVDHAPKLRIATQEAPAPSPTRKSIAVLPFADLSAAKDQSHFCDGLAEELINSLTRIRDLRVLSRAVAFDHRADDDLRALGAKLGVDHILRGSVRKAENRLRISVHLVETQHGHHILSERFDRETGDIFALQEEIAEHAAQALLGVLTERDRNAIKSTPVRLDAYEFYLKGRTYLSQGTQRALEAAIGMFEIAIEFDRDYTPAYAGLADALTSMYALEGDGQLLVRADSVSRRAVELGPNLAETHTCRAHVLIAQKRYRDAEAELAIALSINPNSPEAQARVRELETHAR